MGGKPELIEYDSAPQFRAGLWFLALLGAWVFYLTFGGDSGSTFFIGVATGAVVMRWLVGLNGYRPNANARIIGPNVKLLFYVALIFTVGLTTNLALRFITGGHDGWLAKYVGGLICRYLAGTC